MRILPLCCSRKTKCYECISEITNSDNVENVSINFLEEPQTPEVLSSNQFGTPVLDDRVSEEVHMDVGDGSTMIEGCQFGSDDFSERPPVIKRILFARMALRRFGSRVRLLIPNESGGTFENSNVIIISPQVYLGAITE